MDRRRFIAGLAAAALAPSRHLAAAPFPVKFRKAGPHEALAPFIAAGADAFPEEKAAMEQAAALRPRSESGIRYRTLAPDTFAGEPGGPASAAAFPGEIRAVRHYVLPGNRVRYEIASTRDSRLEYRVGHGRLAPGFHLDREIVTTAARPLFADVTGDLFGASDSFREQLLRGIPYWRARLDSASGIDIYGNQGIAVGDIDGDGRDEIYVCQPGGLPNRLYQIRDGRAQDITDRAGVGLLDDTSSALFLDLRNSGRQDLVVLRANGPVIFLNRGDGTFTLRADAFQFAHPPQGTFTGMSAADYDRDGRLDLYLCTYTYFQSEDQYRYPVPYHDARNGPPNFLFRNRLAADGSGSFEDVTRAAGLDRNNDRFSFAAAWCDYNADVWPDLYVANDFGRNNLYRNVEGRFQDVAREAGVEDIGPGMSAAWFDYDGDGRPDLYVSNMWTDAGQRVTSHPNFAPGRDPALRDAWRRHTKGNSLYRNRGDGTFAETGAEEDVEMGRWAWGADAFDFDYDGAPEILITCGMLTGPVSADLMSFFWRQVVAKSPAVAERSEAYENGWNAINQLIREDYSWNGREPNVFYARRNGRYYDFSGVSGLDCALDSRAFAVTDFDGDGNLDLLLKSRLAPQLQAFRNDSTAGRKSIALRLTGTQSNRDAIGARVEVDGVVQFLQAGAGNVSQHTKVLHFGLRDAARATLVRILWPSGRRQQFENLAAGFRYDITEGSADLKSQPFAARRAATSVANVPGADNQPRTHDTWLLEPVPLPDKRSGPGLLYIGAGERPGVDLRREPSDVAAAYALFRRYLLDWRTGLELPLLLLIDDRSRAHKIYAQPPTEAALAADVAAMRAPDRRRIALPFAGAYVGTPQRNYFKLGAAFYWAGYPEHAVPYLEEVVRRAPANDKALNALGQIHLEAGRLSEARSFLEKAVAANPSLGEAWNNLGGVASGAGDLQAAMRHYDRAIALLPKASYPLVNSGEVAAQLGDSAAAEQRFRRALEVDPADAEAANQMGLLFGKQQRGKEAKEWFQKAIALRRDHAGAINNLGVLYLQLGQAPDAIAAFQYGIRVVPGDELLYMNLARTYVQLGDRAKARETMLLLLQQKPDSAAAKNALRELEVR